jgi:hypothetical protein
MAVIPIPRGHSFTVWTTSGADAYNWAVMYLMRNGFRTDLGNFGPGQYRTFPTLLESGNLHVEGFAGDGAPSAERGYGEDSMLATIRYDDAYGWDQDFNDLVVYVEKKKRFDERDAERVSQLLSPKDIGKIPRLCLIGLSAFAKSSELVAKIDAGQPVVPADYSDLPIVREQLNDEEKKLFDEDPIVGARVLIHAVTTQNSAARQYDESTLLNGNGDAFRHFYWNFRMTKDSGVGGRWAERWGNAHEEGAQNNPPMERTMDLHNNGIGRRIGATNVDDDPRALRASIRIGACRIIRGGQLVKSDSAGEL